MQPFLPFVATAIAALVSACAPVAPSCLLPAQKPMILTDLYFGRTLPGRAPVTDDEWALFARTQITPRFPDGFTIMDAHGQWFNPDTRSIGAEATKMVRIAAPAAADLATRIGAIMAAYRTQFHQIAVGVTSEQVCAAF